jgi:hypothetical protein
LQHDKALEYARLQDDKAQRVSTELRLAAELATAFATEKAAIEKVISNLAILHLVVFIFS